MKKQFDLQYYLEHPETKVVTREGRSVRIICTDAMSENSNKVVGLIQLGGYEGVWMFHPNGLVFEDSENPNDIFFDIPENKEKKVPLTYEDLLERVKAEKTMWLVRDQNTVYNIVDFDVESVYYIFGEVEEVRTVAYEVLMNGITFADGDPCWKEVEE